MAEKPIDVIADTSASRDMMTTASVAHPLTNWIIEVKDATESDTLSTTTTDNSSVQTNEPRNTKRFLIIHVVAGLGLVLIILSGVVVTCISVVCIMRCIQARSVAKLRRSFDREQAEAADSNPIGTLLQENAAYRPMTINEYSYPGYATGYETLPGGEERKSDTRELVDYFDSDEIAVLGNTAYSKSAGLSGDVAVYDTTSTDDKQTYKSTQSTKESNSDGIVVLVNTAYTKSSKRGDIVEYESKEQGKSDSFERSKNDSDTLEGSYETIDETVEQLIPLNLAHGFEGESLGSNMDYEAMTDNGAYDRGNNSAISVGCETKNKTIDHVIDSNLTYPFRSEAHKVRDSTNTADYEMTECGSQIYRDVSKKSDEVTTAEPMTYNMLIQQGNTDLKDSEHQYDHVI